MSSGLYYPDGSFRSTEDIRRESLLREPQPEPHFITEVNTITKDFDYWSERLRSRQTQYLQTVEGLTLAELQLSDTSLLCFQSDQHVGASYTDYGRIELEAKLIVDTPNVYAVLGGDLIDAFFFNPAQFEDLEQIPEQIEYARALVRYYADNKKLLAVWSGNHDQWVKKHGFNPYRYILDGIETYYFHGVGYIKLGIAGQQEYRITGNHMFKGSSMYNQTHPERRAMNESARGSHLVFGGHWHTKGIYQQAFQEFGGDSILSTMIALGAYKSSDEYIKTYGFSNRDPKSMYGAAVRFDKESENLQPYYDIVQAIREFN